MDTFKSNLTISWNRLMKTLQLKTHSKTISGPSVPGVTDNMRIFLAWLQTCSNTHPIKMALGFPLLWTSSPHLQGDPAGNSPLLCVCVANKYPIITRSTNCVYEDRYIYVTYIWILIYHIKWSYRAIVNYTQNVSIIPQTFLSNVVSPLYFH